MAREKNATISTKKVALMNYWTITWLFHLFKFWSFW